MNPLCEKYLTQAVVNESLANCLKQYTRKPFYKWVLVAIYHSALHFFNAFCVVKNLEIKKIHKSKNDFEIGEVDMAVERFCTSKDSVFEALEGDYNQLFQWSNNVRYDPDRSRLLTEATIKEAFSILERCKIILANELKIVPVLSPKGRSVSFQKVDQDELIKKYQAARAQN